MNRNRTLEIVDLFAGAVSHKLLQREGRIKEKHLCQYNQIGNAVPPLLAKAIAERVREATLLARKSAKKSPDLVFGVQGLPCHDGISALS